MRENPHPNPLPEYRARGQEGNSSSDTFTVAGEFNYPDGPTTQPISVKLDLKPEQRKNGQSIRVQIQATDTRNIPPYKAATSGRGEPTSDTLGPQTVTSPAYEIRFRNPAQIAHEAKEESDKLRTILMEMLKTQRTLHETTVAWKALDVAGMKKIGASQDTLRNAMRRLPRPSLSPSRIGSSRSRFRCSR